jgi:presenilin-like A22 family membrane protease
MLVHNITELAIYPGIAAIFVPILSIWAVVLLLILISIWDMYAVWHSGFMQRMAKYQIEKVRIFSGFFVPYLGKKQEEMLKKTKPGKLKKVGVSVAILGGGDVVFPIILAGVVLNTLGFLPALAVSIGATAALATLFYFSEKAKFYPAMPFITAGGLAVAFLL